METIIKAVLVTFLAQVILVSSVAVISGQFFSQTLSAFYAATTPLTRTILTAATTFPLGNFLIAHAFAHYNPAYVGPSVIVASVFAYLVYTFLVSDHNVSLQLFVAAAMVLGGSAWVSFLLRQSA